jgi:hypothetical protein
VCCVLRAGRKIIYLLGFTHAVMIGRKQKKQCCKRGGTSPPSLTCGTRCSECSSASPGSPGGSGGRRAPSRSACVGGAKEWRLDNSRAVPAGLPPCELSHSRAERYFPHPSGFCGCECVCTLIGSATGASSSSASSSSAAGASSSTCWGGDER